MLVRFVYIGMLLFTIKTLYREFFEVYSAQANASVLGPFLVCICIMNNITDYICRENH